MDKTDNLYASNVEGCPWVWCKIMTVVSLNEALDALWSQRWPLTPESEPQPYMARWRGIPPTAQRGCCGASGLDNLHVSNSVGGDCLRYLPQVNVTSVWPGGHDDRRGVDLVTTDSMCWVLVSVLLSLLLSPHWYQYWYYYFHHHWVLMSVLLLLLLLLSRSTHVECSCGTHVDLMQTLPCKSVTFHIAAIKQNSNERQGDSSIH